MKLKMIGDSDCPVAHIELAKGKKIKIERRAMAYMSEISIEGRMNTEEKGFGGLLSALGRSLTSGESMFITEAEGKSGRSYIGIAPAIPGAIHKLTVGQRQYCLNTGAFLASDNTVSYEMKEQSLANAFFGGTGGLFVMKTEGEGDLLVNAFGALVELEVTSDKSLTIDNEHVIAWDASLDYDIEIASGAFGFTTGEGLVNTFHGSGKVLIQTRNLHNLAESLSSYLSGKSNNRLF